MTNNLERKDLLQLKQLFGALSRRDTYQVISYLCKQEEWVDVTQIYNTIDILQTVASNALASLRKYGLVETRREGKHVFYKLVPTRLKEIETVYNLAMLNVK